MTTLRKVLLGGTAMWLLAGAVSAEELNALVWCDHADDALIKPFEDKHGVKVNLREYEGTGAALALLEQSRPGDWDVLVIDGMCSERLKLAFSHLCQKTNYQSETCFLKWLWKRTIVKTASGMP